MRRPCVNPRVFRQPDYDLRLEWLGLTRVQWLSIGLLLAGMAVLVVAIAARLRRWAGCCPLNEPRRR